LSRGKPKKIFHLSGWGARQKKRADTYRSGGTISIHYPQLKGKSKKHKKEIKSRAKYVSVK
jgi:hypothetical protein